MTIRFKPWRRQTISDTLQTKGIFTVSSIHRYPREHCVLVGFQASTVCPSGKSNMWLKMGVERWWNDTDWGKQDWEKKCVPLPFHPSQISHRLFQDRTRSSALIVQYHSTNAPRSYHQCYIILGIVSVVK